MIRILNRYTGAVLHESTAETLRDANLAHADLWGANLTYANLRDADLRGAKR